jgi:DNA-directed RNA polymerase subunit RPC12/RpoP
MNERPCLFCLQEQDQPRTNQTNQCPVCGRNILIKKEDKYMINNNLQPIIKDVLKDVVRENIDKDLLKNTIQEVLSEMLCGNTNHNEEQQIQEEDEYEEPESKPIKEDGRRKNCIDFEFREFLKKNYVLDENSSISKEEIIKHFGKDINKRRFGGTIKSLFGNIMKYKMVNHKVCSYYPLNKKRQNTNKYCETCGQYQNEAHKPKGREIPCPSCGYALREIG